MPRVVPRPKSMPRSTASPRSPRQCRPSHTEGATWIGVVAWREKRFERFQGGVAWVAMTPSHTPIASPRMPIALANTT